MNTEPSLPFTVVKALTESGFLGESLMKSLACHEISSAESVHFALGSLSESVEGEWLENLQLGFLNSLENPGLALNMVLKALAEMPPPLTREIVDELRIALIQLPENPLMSLNLCLKSVSEVEGLGFSDELRKGFLELTENKPEPATNHFLRFVELQKNSNQISDFRKAILKFPEAPWKQALSSGQIQSKMWVLEEWRRLNLPTVEVAFVLGGWLGILPMLTEITKTPLANKYRSFDIDKECATVAETINKSMVLDSWKFKATTEDMHKINYHSHDYETLRSDGSGVRLIETPDLVINTSCEHIENYAGWYDRIPGGTLLILQSNNFFDEPTHINCSKNLDEFKNSSPMTEVLYAGGRPFPLYNRYMLIGKK